MSEEPEDVEATLQHDTTPDTSQKKTWRAIDWITGITFVAEVVWGAIWLVTQVFHWCSWNPPGNAEYFFAQFYCGVGLGILSFGYLTLILWPIIFNILLKILKMLRIFKQDKDSKQGNDPRWFHARILSSGIVGGSYAFLLPAVMSLEEGSLTSGGATALRQAILLATGGLIGLIALGETRRKNDNDKLKNDQDHRRQVRAGRRERYTKAVEQLGDEKAPIRMGGVYTLVGLVDEWLEDESIEKYEDRLKEGQVIINNLCAYIRSPFTPASHYDELLQDTPAAFYKDREQEFYTDKATLESEADVRLGIIKEIHDRLQGPEEKTPGTWSDFEYDFSGSTFFYPVDLTKSYYKNPAIFNNSHYYKKVNFSGSIYNSQVSFRGSIYKKKVTFSSSKSRSIYRGASNFSSSIYKRKVIFSTPAFQVFYEGSVDFSGSKYHSKADFRGSIYKKKVTFSSSKSRSIYKGSVDFSGSKYHSKADFRGSIYEKEAIFSTLDFESIQRNKPQFTLQGSGHEGNALFGASGFRSIYEGAADFSGSKYHSKADFRGSIYEKGVIFSTYRLRSTYEGAADFSRSGYRGQAAVFHGSTYKHTSDFRYSFYEKGATFSTPDLPSTYEGAADFSGSKYHSKADFRGSIYEKGATFSTPDLPSTYKDTADFSYSTYKEQTKFTCSIYEGEAIFSAPNFCSTYEGTADFSSSIYKRQAIFHGSTYKHMSDFCYSIYKEDAIFSTTNLRSTYEGAASFNNSIYLNKVDFSDSIYLNKVDLSHSTYQRDVIFNSYRYKRKVDFSSSIYRGETEFNSFTYEYEVDFSGSIFIKRTYFGEGGNTLFPPRFTGHAPQFYDKTNRKNTLFGSHNNDFTVDTKEGYPIVLNSEGIPLKCEFINSEQKEYLECKLQEIEKLNNKLFDIKDSEENTKPLDIRSLNEDLHTWRKEATTVKVEDDAIEG